MIVSNPSKSIPLMPNLREAGLRLRLNYQWSLIRSLIRDFICISFVWLTSLKEQSKTKLMQTKPRMKLRTRLHWLERLGFIVNSSQRCLTHTLVLMVSYFITSFHMCCFVNLVSERKHDMIFHQIIHHSHFLSNLFYSKIHLYHTKYKVLEYFCTQSNNFHQRFVSLDQNWTSSLQKYEYSQNILWFSSICNWDCLFHLFPWVLLNVLVAHIVFCWHLFWNDYVSSSKIDIF